MMRQWLDVSVSKEWRTFDVLQHKKYVRQRLKRAKAFLKKQRWWNGESSGFTLKSQLIDHSPHANSLRYRFHRVIFSRGAISHKNDATKSTMTEARKNLKRRRKDNCLIAAVANRSERRECRRTIIRLKEGTLKRTLKRKPEGSLVVTRSSGHSPICRAKRP